MAYEFQVHESYFVDAAWFYCMSEGIGHLDDAHWEAAVAATGKADKAEAVLDLVQGHMTALGFQIGEWAIVRFNDEVLDYETFPLNHLDYYINISSDAVATEDSAGFPVSVQTNYTPAAQALVGVLQIDDFEPVTIVEMRRLDRDEDDSDEVDDV